MMLSDLAQLDSRFGWFDWLLIVAYLLLTTVIGARLAGKQATIRDFFLGGRKLPWWAVSGSIIATEISAVTFLAVPTMVFPEGGNLTYLQWALGAILARVIIGFYFVPKYYEREIYSPYDYLEERLGSGVKKVTTGLFFVGAILGQGARVYVTAFVLSAITGLNLTPSIWIIGAFSVCWTLLGGITTVIWTDVVQFGVLTLGAFLTLWWAVAAVPGGVDAVVETAAAAGKFDWFDGAIDLSSEYTIWVGLLAMPFMNLAAFGTDQVMAQRMFCCRNERDACKAIIISSISVAVALLMLCVGMALYCYFRINPFTSEEAGLYEAKKTYLMPIFIVRALPVGVRGLIVAAVFAAAISSLDSALAALSQTTLSAFIRRRPAGRRRNRGGLRGLLSTEIGFSKGLVVAWGVVLCLMATACIALADQYANAVELAFALVGYTYGPLLGILLLALFPLKRDHSGLVWAVPTAMLAVFGIYVHDPWADWIVWGGAATLLVLGMVKLQGSPARVAAIVVGVLVVVLLHRYQAGTTPEGRPTYLAFTWSYPIGTAITLALGYCLGRPKQIADNQNRVV